MDKEKCNSESSTNQVSEKNDIDDKLSEPIVESISLQVSNDESKSVELLNKSDSADESLPKQLSSDKMIVEPGSSGLDDNKHFKSMTTPLIPVYAEPGSSKSFDIKEKKILANAGKLSTNVDERKRSSEIANDSPLKKSSTRSLTENNYALENIRKISPPTYDDLMSASTSFDSPSSPDLSRSNDSANYYSNLLTQELLAYQNNWLQESAKEFRECLNLFAPKTHQFMYVKTDIIPLLIRRHHEIEPPESTSQYAKNLENIIYNLIDDEYQTVRQCITDINKLFMQIYLQQFQDDSSNSWLNEIKTTQQYFHEMVSNINWESRKKPNESKYHPISKITGSGKVTSQFTYLLDVLQSLQEHEYGYLLKQENNNNMTEIPGTSSSDVSRITVITLEVIRDRLLNKLYSSVEQCIQDIDELFIDSFIFKLWGPNTIPMIHILYDFFRQQIIDMPKGIDAEEDSTGIYYIEEHESKTVSKKTENNEFGNFVEYFKDVINTLITTPLKAEKSKDYTIFFQLMNFSTIQHRLQSNYYTTPYECREHFDKVFDNVLQTQRHDIAFYTAAMDLKKVYDEKMKMFFDKQKKRDS